MFKLQHVRHSYVILSAVVSLDRHKIRKKRKFNARIEKSKMVETSQTHTISLVVRRFSG